MKAPYAEILNLIELSWDGKGNPPQEIEVVKNWLTEIGYYPLQKETKDNVQSKNWKEFTIQLVKSYCDEINSPTFTLQDLQHTKKLEIENFSKNNKHPFDKIRQQLQFLRADGYINFVDNKGTYFLSS